MLLTYKQRTAALKGQAPSLLVCEILSLHTTIHMNFVAAKEDLRVIETQIIKLFWVGQFEPRMFSKYDGESLLFV